MSQAPITPQSFASADVAAHQIAPLILELAGKADAAAVLRTDVQPVVDAITARMAARKLYDVTRTSYPNGKWAAEGGESLDCVLKSLERPGMTDVFVSCALDHAVTFARLVMEHARVNAWTGRFYGARSALRDLRGIAGQRGMELRP
jgi:hypothetical protein